MNHKHGLTARYAVIQGMYWMGFCLIFSYSSVYLLDRGFSNTEIGLVIGIAGTISAVLQPLVGGMADGKKRISLRMLIVMLGMLMVVLGAGLLMVPDDRRMTVLFYVLLVVFLQVLTPLIYSLGMDCVNQGLNLNFGLARGIGSLAFAGISFVAGILVTAYGTKTIPVLVIGCYGGLGWFVSRFRFQKAAVEEETEAVPEHENKRSFFVCYPKYMALLIGAILVFASHNMVNNFLFQIMESKGGGSSSMGTAMALAAAAELPTMFMFAWMVKRAGSDVWLKVSGVFFMMKALGTLLVGSVMGMYVLQLLQMFGFGLFVVSSVYYVNQIMEEKDRVKGQAYMTVTNTLGGVLGSALGGALIDGFGIQMMLTVSVVAAAAGMGIMSVSTEKGSRE